MKKVKIQQLKNGLTFISIPKQFCLLKDWKKGDTLCWIAGRGLILSKLEDEPIQKL